MGNFIVERKKIVLATTNAGKVREMRDAFQALPVEIVPLSEFGDLPEAVEDGETFAENSRIKAAFYAKQTGCACLADDSGLSVDALDGAPGVHSARWSGTHDDAANNRKLAAELSKLTPPESEAAYHCVLTFVDTDGTSLVAEGICGGIVRPKPHGSGGFGYDPYFYLPGRNGEQTMADLTLEEKQEISHRGAALRQMARLLGDYLRESGK